MENIHTAGVILHAYVILLIKLLVLYGTSLYSFSVIHVLVSMCITLLHNYIAAKDILPALHQ